VASKPIRIEFVAEVAQYLRDTKKLEVSTEDIADALNATTKNADDLERKLGRAMKGAEKDAESLKRVLDDLPKSTGKAAKAADDDFRKIGDDAKEAGREAGQEFRQNLGESLASGNLSDLFSDTLGGLISSLQGPIGIAAAGIGAGALLIFNKLKEDWQATVDAMNTLAQSLVDKQIELGRQFLFQSEKLEVMRGIIKENPELWGKVRVAAEALGYTLDDVAAAMLGGTAEADAFKRKLQDAVQAGTTLEQGTGRISLTGPASQALQLLQLMQQTSGAVEGANTEFLNMQSLLGQSATNAQALQNALRNARDYAAGVGGRRPLVGVGQNGGPF
jgi:hypothetical protein